MVLVQTVRIVEDVLLLLLLVTQLNTMTSDEGKRVGTMVYPCF